MQPGAQPGAQECRQHGLWGPVAWEHLGPWLGEQGKSEGEKPEVSTHPLFKNPGPISHVLRKHPTFQLIETKLAGLHFPLTIRTNSTILMFLWPVQQASTLCKPPPTVARDTSLFTLTPGVWKSIIGQLRLQSHSLWHFSTTPFAWEGRRSHATSGFPRTP